MNFMSVFNKLYDVFGPQHWWPAKVPSKTITEAILTQNTAWSNVEKALNNFKGRLSPQFIITMPEKGLSLWFKRYDYNIEIIHKHNSLKIRHELLALQGVGFETATRLVNPAKVFSFSQNNPLIIIKP